MVGRIKNILWRCLAVSVLLGAVPQVQTSRAVEVRCVDGQDAATPEVPGDNSPRSTGRITLEPLLPCFGASASDTITISVWVHSLTDVIQGGQFYLAYDSTMLDFISADPAPTVFTFQVYESVDEDAGAIDYATGVRLGPPNLTLYPDHVMATLTFQLTPGHDGVCDVASLVWFRPHVPPTRLTTTTNPIVLLTDDLDAITADSVPPTIAPPASDQSVESDGSGNTFQLNHWLNNHGGADATDNCGFATWTNDYSESSWVDDCGGGKHVQVTFSAMDACANSATTTATFRILAVLPGDLDCNCVVNFDDIGPFVLALLNAAMYQIEYQSCDIHRADLNGDGAVDGADIQLFLNALLGG